LSDEVARLGEYRIFGAAFVDAMAEVNRLRGLCDEAQDELERHEDYVEAMRAHGASASSASAS
jgi:hypothetical protein